MMDTPKRRSLITCFVVTLAAVGPAAAGWTVDHTIPSDDLFMSIQAVDSQVVYTCGLSDTAGAMGGTVYGTKNGGANWYFMGPNVQSFFFGGLDFIDRVQGWFAGIQFVKPAVFRTQDGGMSFQKLNTPEGIIGALMDVDFVDNMTGWAVGDSGTVLITINGGMGWRDLNAPVVGVRVEGIQMFDYYEGWVTGGDFDSRTRSGSRYPFLAHDPFGTSSPRANPRAVYSGYAAHTLDGGRSWDLKLSNEPAHLTDVFFLDDKMHGWVCGEGNTEAVIYATTDGGDNWTQQPIPQHPRGPILLLNSIHFVDEFRGWAVGYAKAPMSPNPASVIIYSTNGGLSWQPDPFSVPGLMLMGLTFPPGRDDIGWTCGNSLTVLKYTDDGTIDLTPPVLRNPDPAKGETGVDAATGISFDLIDTESGVDLTSVQTNVNGTQIAFGSQPISGGYTFSYQPSQSFAAGQRVTVRVDACDQASTPNCMITENYTFTIQEVVDKSPPEVVDIAPVPGSTVPPPVAGITFGLRDVDSGVDLNSIVLTVDGTRYLPGGATLQVTGTATRYDLTFRPPVPFAEGGTVEWRINACDFYGTPNCLADAQFSFTVATQPFIYLAGYWTGFQDGRLVMMALPGNPAAVNTFEIYFDGAGIGVYLNDTGANGDLVPGDGLYGFEALLGLATPGRYPLELGIESPAGLQSDLWPYLTVH